MTIKLLIFPIFLYLGMHTANAKNSSRCDQYFMHTSRSTLLDSGINSNVILSFWKMINKKNSKNTPNLESQLHFQNYIDEALALSEENKSFDLAQPISKKQSTRTLSTLLYLLSYTSQGRKLIEVSFPYLSGRKQSDDRLHFRLYLTRFSLLGQIDYFSFSDNSKPKILINNQLKIGTALVVFAHELTHVINQARFHIYSVVHKFETALALDEIIAFKTEQIVIQELETYKSFRVYQEFYKADPINQIYALSDEDIYHRLLKGYGIDAKTLKEAFLIYNIKK